MNNLINNIDKTIVLLQSIVEELKIMIWAERE